MNKFILLPLVAIAFMALAGCAPVPMKIDEWETSISHQELRLRDSDICCEFFNDLEFVPLTDGENQLQLDVDGQVMILEGHNKPVIGLEISRASRPEHLEFFSYSERKRAFLRLNRVLFLRPNIVWLDDQYHEISSIIEPELCYGHKRGIGGLWGQFEIPKSARLVIIYPTIDNPTQPIDTRNHPGVTVGAVGDAIADARKTYYTDVRLGLEGEIGIELFSERPRTRGTCRS